MANIEPSYDTLKSGAVRGRLMVEGHVISYTSKKIGVNPDGTKKYESKEVVKRKVNEMYRDFMRRAKVSGSWKVEDWLDYWLKNYKLPLNFEYSDVKGKRKKGGKVAANSYNRLNVTYRCQIKGTKAGKLLLRKTLDTVVLDDVQKLINELEEKGYSDSTVKKAQNLLNAAFNVAVINHYMRENPCVGVSRSGSSQSDGKIVDGGVLTMEAMEKLFVEALRVDEQGNQIYRYGAGVALQLAIGCRSGELRALTWDNVTEDMISIEHSVAWVSDVDEDGNLVGKSHVHISSTKSAASIRTIPYDKGDVIDCCLKVLRKRCESIKNSNNLVLPTSRGWYLTPNNYNKEVKRIVNVVCDEIMASHALRHSFISCLVNDENRDLASIASLVGHGDIRVTLHYASHTAVEKKKATLKPIASLYINKEETAS